MRAEVIAIGDELTTGQRLDTNTQWLSEQLTQSGVEVAFHSTVGDQLDDNVVVFRSAIERADIVVATGGLGPTADDLTREAIAAAVRVELVRHEQSLDFIRDLFARRGRAMPERNAVQADFPVGATPIPNSHGTAPGIQMAVEKERGGTCHVYALPGVPAELKPMWFDTVQPAVLSLQPSRRVFRHRRIKCFGVGESQLEAMLPDLIRRGREPTVGITVSDATITLRVTAAGDDEAACLASMEPTLQTIREILADLVFGDEDDELQDAVARILTERRETLAVAEWATGGQIAEWLVDAGQDRAPIFQGGLTVTSMRAVASQLGDPDAAQVAPDSSQAATRLAEAVRTWAGADYGIGVSAFPTNADSPDARVFISIASSDRTRRLRFGCASHPAIRKPRTAKQALNAFRMVLLGRDVREA